MSARGLAALERLADAVERLAADYAVVHNIPRGRTLTECPQCHQRVDSSGQIFHLSGCASLWPEPFGLRIPGEGL